MPHNTSQLPVSSMGQPSIVDECSPSTSAAPIATKTKIIPRNSAADVVFRGPVFPENHKSFVEINKGDAVGDYCIQELIMSGGFGKIYLGHHRNTPQYKMALKFINPALPRAKIVACKEIAVMRQIRENPIYHAHLVLMANNFEYGATSVIVMEKLDCDLFDYMAKHRKWKPLEAKVVVDLSKQLLRANAALLDMNYVHADIKLENIMLVDRNAKKLRIKLIDYGCAVSKEHVRKLNSHTLNYRAPECILGLPTCERADSWSLGMVVYELYTGLEIFEAVNLHQLIRQQHSVIGLPDNYWKGTKFSEYFEGHQNDSEPSFSTPIGFVDKPAEWKFKGFEKLFDHSLAGKLQKRPSTEDKLVCDLVTGLLHKNAAERPSTKEALLFLEDGIPISERRRLGLV